MRKRAQIKASEPRSQSARAKLARRPKKLAELISPQAELLREAAAGDEHAQWRAKELYDIDF